MKKVYKVENVDCAHCAMIMQTYINKIILEYPEKKIEMKEIFDKLVPLLTLLPSNVTIHRKSVTVTDDNLMRQIIKDAFSNYEVNENKSNDVILNTSNEHNSSGISIDEIAKKIGNVYTATIVIGARAKELESKIPALLNGSSNLAIEYACKEVHSGKVVAEKVK